MRPSPELRFGTRLAAGLAGWIGVRGGIAIGWAGMAVSILLLVFSPLPRVRQPSDVAPVELSETVEA